MTTVPSKHRKQGPPAQQARQHLRVLANSMTEEEKKDFLFITKARDRLWAHVPKYRGPRTECWHLWKNAWTTSCNNTMHPQGDTDGKRFAIKEALTGEAGGHSGCQRSAVLEEHHGPAASNFMAGMTDMQAAFESLNHDSSDFQ
ncbi:MAG: hypothetical protein GY696_31835 [Gammaproteobacteria bacterium]|nr:hypothetical protein [Gammaproteobacteria bacterium]